MAECKGCNTIDGLGESATFLRQMLPGIPLTVLQQKYSEALIDLCERGLVWRYVFDELMVYPDIQEYALNKELDQDVVKVLDVYTQSKSSCGECNQHEFKVPKRVDIQRDGGNSQGWYEPEPALLVFNECWDCERCLRVSVALKPEFGKTDFPPDLLRKWKKVLEYGVLAKAHLMPNQEWSDNERFGYFDGLFENAINDERLRVRRDLHVGRPQYSRRNGGYMPSCRVC